LGGGGSSGTNNGKGASGLGGSGGGVAGAAGGDGSTRTWVYHALMNMSSRLQEEFVAPIILYM